MLVLTGELDTITTPAEATLVTRQFPYARRVVVRNSFHVTAIGDTDDCAQRIVRHWISTQGVVIPTRPAGLHPGGTAGARAGQVPDGAPGRMRHRGGWRRPPR